jgi:hypothetical protein
MPIGTTSGVSAVLAVPLLLLVLLGMLLMALCDRLLAGREPDRD